MWKAALAGVMLATTGVSFCLADDFSNASYQQHQSAHRGPTVTEGHIARLKSALKLTAEQQRHWPAVASALRNLGRKVDNSANAQGIKRASAAVGSADALRRVASAARPLIASLTEQQKQAGMQVIRASGFASLASAM